MQKKTATTIFIVPTLKIGRNKLEENGFINGYISDKNRDVQYENVAYLLFKPKNLELFNIFLEIEYDKLDCSLLEDYDYEGGYVVLIHRLNKDYLEDYNLIKQGKYSKTSADFQNLFPRKIPIRRNGFMTEEKSLQYRIFNKTEDLRKYWEDKLDLNFSIPDDMEVWDEFNIENETLDIEKLKGNEQKQENIAK